MGKFSDILVGVGVTGLLALGIGSLCKDAKEEKIRKSTPCSFPVSMTESDFEQIVINESKQIKRLWVEVNGHIVYGTVKAISGLSKWSFTLDFNDYGSITGRYWLQSDNQDSLIPKTLGNRIKEIIEVSA